MGQLIDSETTPLGALSKPYQNKFEDYKLEEFATELYLKGFNAARIAKECNNALLKRPDTNNYIRLTPANATAFIKKIVKEKELADPHQLTRLDVKAVDLNEKLQNTISIIETEVDNLRTVDGAVSGFQAEILDKLLKRLIDTLELTGNIQGKLQPSITFNVFQTNIEKFCDKISNTNLLEDSAKKIVIQFVTEELLNESLLKQVEGNIVDKKG